MPRAHIPFVGPGEAQLDGLSPREFGRKLYADVMAKFPDGPLNAKAIVESFGGRVVPVYFGDINEIYLQAWKPDDFEIANYQGRRMAALSSTRRTMALNGCGT